MVGRAEGASPCAAGSLSNSSAGSGLEGEEEGEEEAASAIGELSPVPLRGDHCPAPCPVPSSLRRRHQPEHQ